MIEGGLATTSDSRPTGGQIDQVSEAKLRSYHAPRGGCIPRIAKVVNPVDIARVGAGVHASRCGQAGLPTIAD